MPGHPPDPPDGSFHHRRALPTPQRKTAYGECWQPSTHTPKRLSALKPLHASSHHTPRSSTQNDINAQIEADFALLDSVVYTIRNIRGEMKLLPGAATDIHIIGTAGDKDVATIQANIHLIQALVKTKQVFFHQEDPSLGFASTGAIGAIKLLIPLPDELIAQEKARLGKEKERLELQIGKLQQQLSNSDFVANAPPALVEKHQQQLAQAQQQLLALQVSK